jgi:predicted restriction endonuclease
MPCAVLTTKAARSLRNQAFARQVRLSYDSRCAVTGLRLMAVLEWHREHVFKG